MACGYRDWEPSDVQESLVQESNFRVPEAKNGSMKNQHGQNDNNPEPVRKGLPLDQIPLVVGAEWKRGHGSSKTLIIRSMR